MEEKSNLEKLREAWETMPLGAKNKLYNHYGYTHQNVSDILKKGRKDEKTILDLLADIKHVSDEVTKDIATQNEKIQAI